MYNRHKTFEECLEMDIESIFSRDNYDEVVSRAYAYNHSMYKIFILTLNILIIVCIRYLKSIYITTLII